MIVSHCVPIFVLIELLNVNKNIIVITHDFVYRTTVVSVVGVTGSTGAAFASVVLTSGSGEVTSGSAVTSSVCWLISSTGSRSTSSTSFWKRFWIFLQNRRNNVHDLKKLLKHTVLKHTTLYTRFT